MTAREDRVEMIPARGSARSDRSPANGEASTNRPEPPKSPGRARHTLPGWRRFALVAYRDPEHVAERLALHGTQTLGEPALKWARRVREERSGVPRAVIAEELCKQGTRAAAIYGAIAGTPFYLALIPGYLAYLQEETRVMLRTAALYDRDPREPEAAAEMLVLRGVHKTIEGARSAVLAVQDAPTPEKAKARRPLHTWVHSVYTLLIFGGFLSAPSSESKKGSHPRLKTALGFLLAATIWAITWVLPLTFMIAMAWGCGASSRRLGHQSLTFYDGEFDHSQAAIAAANRRQDPGHRKRQILRIAIIIISVVIPIAFIADIDHVRQNTGLSWLTATGSLVALSLVIATALAASRR